jgi:hypothetical protein
MPPPAELVKGCGRKSAQGELLTSLLQIDQETKTCKSKTYWLPWFLTVSGLKEKNGFFAAD